MKFIGIFQVLLFDFLLGYTLGRLMCWRSLFAGRRDSENRPKSAERDTGYRYEGHLRELQEQLLNHTSLLHEMEHWLASTVADTPCDSDEDAKERVARMRWSNHRVVEAIDPALERLSNVEGSFGDILHEDIGHLRNYRDRSKELDHELKACEESSELSASVHELLAAVHDLRHENEALREELAICQQRLRKQINRCDIAEKEARVDPLTRLPNRRAFDERISDLQSHHERHQRRYFLLLLDLDQFKTVNDVYGHAAGDAVLAMVGRVLQETCRGSDHVSRFGGEEFALLVTDCDVVDAKNLAERTRARIEAARLRYAGHELGVTVSGGMAQVASGETTRKLIARADAALYSAKRLGGNMICADTVTELETEPSLVSSPSGG